MLQAPSSPIIVRVIEEPEYTALVDVLVGAIGLTGAIVLGALILGVLLAGLFILQQKIKRRLGPVSAGSETQQLGLSTPESR